MYGRAGGPALSARAIQSLATGMIDFESTVRSGPSGMLMPSLSRSLAATAYRGAPCPAYGRCSMKQFCRSMNTTTSVGPSALHFADTAAAVRMAATHRSSVRAMKRSRLFACTLRKFSGV